MNGLELSKAYYLRYGEPMLRECFPELEGLLAVGLCGSGSECFGFDDDISRDHDFDPGFCIFIPGEDVIDGRTEFRLQRAYAKLPQEFEGLTRGILSPVGGNRRGVIRMGDFFLSRCGNADGRLDTRQWLTVPEYALAEAVNGEVFRDDSGTFSAVRERLKAYPEDIRIKKLAGYVLTMAQAGQYNYSRCIARGETGAAQLAAHAFVDAAMHTAFLLHGRYMPYYKWSFRALRELEAQDCPWVSSALEYLISSDNSPENAKRKAGLIEEISQMTAAALAAQQLTDAVCGDLEKHAYSVNDHIRDGMLRNMNIFAGVS